LFILGPHWTDAVTTKVASLHNVAYVHVPESLTHLFQPLDLGIIAALKATILRRNDDAMEAEVALAVKEGRTVTLSTSRPVMRNRVTSWIAEALQDPRLVSATCCYEGFRRAGVARVLLGDHGSADVDAIAEWIDAEAAVEEEKQPCADCNEPHAQDYCPTCMAVLCEDCAANHTVQCS
jgi:hypothetical protein